MQTDLAAASFRRARAVEGRFVSRPTRGGPRIGKAGSKGKNLSPLLEAGARARAPQRCPDRQGMHPGFTSDVLASTSAGRCDRVGGDTRVSSDRTDAVTANSQCGPREPRESPTRETISREGQARLAGRGTRSARAVDRHECMQRGVRGVWPRVKVVTLGKSELGLLNSRCQAQAGSRIEEVPAVWGGRPDEVGEHECQASVCRRTVAKQRAASEDVPKRRELCEEFGTNFQDDVVQV